MPYISKDKRAEIYDEDNNSIILDTINKPGELNYAITEMAINYAESKGHSYTTYNEIVGILECAKLEFYRRSIAHYEDEKMEINGDVY